MTIAVRPNCNLLSDGETAYAQGPGAPQVKASEAFRLACCAALRYALAEARAPATGACPAPHMRQI
jgi:hypothetical protein